jgi:hypothetical protein
MAKHIAPERVIEKLKSRIVVAENGCWLYTGALAAGYGNIGWSLGHRRMVNDRTHRVLYQAMKGPIPEGLDLDHTCHDPRKCHPDNPADCPHRRCCNPDHLEPVTRRENLRRGGGMAGQRAAVTECPQGHSYDDENTMVDKLGRRNCKKCVYARNRAAYERNREKRVERNRQWREENSEAYNARRRAKRQQAMNAKQPE